MRVSSVSEEQGKPRVCPLNFFHFKCITKPETSPSREKNFDSERMVSNIATSKRIGQMTKD